MTAFRFPRPTTPYAHSSTGRSRFRWRPGALLVVALLALLVSSPTLSALRIGTKNAETLTGTKGKDQLTGAAGNDLLQGLAGNDTYFFTDRWGDDELVEKPGEGTDTLNFRGVLDPDRLQVSLVREWDPDPNAMYATGTGSIDFSTAAGLATIEKVIGGPGGYNFIFTGSGPHTLQPGGGTLDDLRDYGGWNDGPGGLPELAVSNDVYKGFGDNTGTDVVSDWGGTGDVVDLRPFSTEDVYIGRIDGDSNGTEESLQIVTGLTSQVYILGHYGPTDSTPAYGQQGRIEKLIFADATFTSTNGLAAATAFSATATSGKQARLADTADRLAEEARAYIAEMPEPGTWSDSGGAGAESGPKPGGEPARANKADTKQTPATKAPHEKKHAKKSTRVKKRTNSRASDEKKHTTKATQKKKPATKATRPRP